VNFEPTVRDIGYSNRDQKSIRQLQKIESNTKANLMDCANAYEDGPDG